MLTAKDLLPIRLLHNGMRVEYGRLAAVARAPRDVAHAALIEDQIALTLNILHHHHTAEDTHFWPALRARAPRSVAGLDRLEAQHAEIDPLLRLAGDTSITLPERAGILAELQTLIGAHLDEEEAIGFPLIMEHFTPEEFARIDEEVQQGISRRDIPVLYGWLASAADPKLRADALATVPFVPRILFRLIWSPSYQRRFARLGYPAAATARETVLTGDGAAS
ncbi:hemerythrin domain-containing protein [Frankia sp. CNm7]|uniref:Hemerythrin domain-containing protein n=1 Tax=Frankia nepalensis TaxID=1836974 RepID=A0A937RQ99_9ACTN|nr:hemerythrin domain-containing protein [Frankia nepalensis]MBL7501837.1 hemerythrin domain-containing protein [Frankia nepalensis]MBL7514093.1 hemerythrin domain-containing protein [Frankia nepalensis]MBL7522869.1 hemerythrin domain-containing protein [Frankia nepalensis]MBL7632944.1 hemerythrin domain-containing protein [Frankia nepalensis]